MNIPAEQSDSMTPPTRPRDEHMLNSLAADMPLDQHNLAPCAAAFCDGDLARYRELYNVVFAHKQSANSRVFHRRASAML